MAMSVHRQNDLHVMFALNMNFGVVGRKIESVGVIEDIWS
jgi:hypothetical protein